jgi:hypothetical protein
MMSINKHATNHRKKLMEMGMREKILLEGITRNLINPYLNKNTTYKQYISSSALRIPLLFEY